MGRRNRRTPEQSAEKYRRNFAKALEEGRAGRPKKNKDTESKSGTK